MLAKGLHPLGLTPSQAEVLRVLQDHQPLSLMELGGLLVCETAAPVGWSVGWWMRGSSNGHRRKPTGMVTQSLTRGGEEAASGSPRLRRPCTARSRRPLTETSSQGR